MKLLSLFSGIGAFEKALSNIGIEYELVGFSEIDKYAIESYSAIHGVSTDLNLGDISKIKSEDIPKADLVTYGFPCFTGDTLVYTDVGIKQLKDVKIGDRVLTHKNRFRDVTAFLEQGAKDIWGVQTMNSHLIRTTSNHKFFVRTKNHIWNNEQRRYKRTFNKPYWKEVKDFTRDDYVGYAINTKNNEYSWDGIPYGKWNKLVNELPIKDERLWYLAGRYIGDGWIVRRKSRKNNIGRVVICTSLNEADEFENKIGDLYNYSKVKEGSIYKYHFTNKELGHFMQQFGEGAKNKHIPVNILNLDIKYLKPLSKGLLDADGSYTEGYYKLTSVSKKLVYSYGQLVAKVYKRPFSIYKTNKPDKCIIEGRIVNQSNTYQITFKLQDNKKDEAFYEDGYIWFPVRDVRRLGYKEDVYDITVEEDHSFTAYGSIVHNCQDVSIAGNQEGIKEGTRSGLLYEAERIIEHIKPKYAIAENVKNLVGKRHKKDFEKLLERLDEYGYNSYWEILNAKDFGIPQNRERVFVVSIRKDIDNKTFEFPKPTELKVKLKDMLDATVEDKYMLTEKQHKNFIFNISNNTKEHIKAESKGVYDVVGTTLGTGAKGTNSRHWVYGTDKTISTLDATMYKQPKQILVEDLDIEGCDKTKTVPASNTMNGIQGKSKVIVKEATKKGYDIATEDDSINISFPNSKTRRGRVGKGVAQTLETNCNQAVLQVNHTELPCIYDDRDKGFNGLKTSDICPTQRAERHGLKCITEEYKIRKLTPLECWRLMGFTDDDYWTARTRLEETFYNGGDRSNSQMYKQAGNSIVVSVLEELFIHLFKS